MRQGLTSGFIAQWSLPQPRTAHRWANLQLGYCAEVPLEPLAKDFAMGFVDPVGGPVLGLSLVTEALALLTPPAFPLDILRVFRRGKGSGPSTLRRRWRRGVGSLSPLVRRGRQRISRPRLQEIGQVAAYGCDLVEGLIQAPARGDQGTYGAPDLPVCGQKLLLRIGPTRSYKLFESWTASWLRGEGGLQAFQGYHHIGRRPGAGLLCAWAWRIWPPLSRYIV